MACGFIQQYSIDSDETYTPITRLALLHLILVITAQQDWNIDFFDFYSTFLNAKLNDDEIIFMELLPGFNNKPVTLLPDSVLQSTDLNKEHSNDINIWARSWLIYVLHI